MGMLQDSLAGLVSAHDAELLDGYARYEALLATILTPQQMRAYADYIRQTGKIRIFEEMSPREMAALPPEIAAVAASVISDLNISMENRRVVALLDQRGELAAAPAEGEHSRRLGTNGIE
jgi:hypothetical protein